MQERHIIWVAGLLALNLLCPVSAVADDRIAQADRLYQEGGFESYRQAIALYEQVIAASPESFEALWKCARVHQWFGDLARHRQVPGWKAQCQAHGQAGMQYAARAIELEPERVEGYFFYGCSAGTYSDGVGFITLMREGIGGKIEKNLLEACRLDKRFDHGGPLQALGQFYSLLPWPLRNEEKALFYLRESRQIFPDDPCGLVFLAELLLKSGKDKDRQEAVQLLQAAAAPDPALFPLAVVEIYGTRARSLLSQLSSEP